MERITTPFGFHSTAGDVIAGVDLRTKRAIVTGAASGIGVETASALARAGADVTLAVRSREAGEEIAATIRRDTGSDSVGVRELDLSERESIARFVAAWSGPLHILVNNAGIMALPELTKTTDGWKCSLQQFSRAFRSHHRLASRARCGAWSEGRIA